MKAVKQLIHDPIRSKHPYEFLTKDLTDIINIRKRDK